MQQIGSELRFCHFANHLEKFPFFMFAARNSSNELGRNANVPMPNSTVIKQTKTHFRFLFRTRKTYEELSQLAFCNLLINGTFHGLRWKINSYQSTD